MPSNQRIVRVAVSFPLLRQFLVQGWSTEGKTIRCKIGIPESARFVGDSWDPMARAAYFFFEDDSFPEIEVGAVVPIFSPVWEEVGNAE